MEIGVLLMTTLSQAEIANWLALYAAAGVCCGLAVMLSVATSIYDLYREREIGRASVGKECW